MSDELQYALAAKEAFSGNPTGPQLGALGAKLLSEFSKAEQDRLETETRWLQDLRQFKGKYDPDVLALLDANRSKVFVRKTRVKVKTANSRVEDLLFPSGSEKNWEVDTTPVPSVPRELRQAVIQSLQQMAQGQAQLTREMVDKEVLRVCKEAAKGMAQVIEDQLSETRYKQICKKVINSCHLYGTGVLKGPLVERRIRSKFVKENGKWVEKTESYVVPFIDFVPLWRIYPDMEATELEDCRFVYERHQMTRSKLVDLAGRKSFHGKVIKEYLEAHPAGQVTLKTIDSELKVIGERESQQGGETGTYEVLERWGWLTGAELKECGAKVPDDRLQESFFGNVWLLPNGVVIKAVLNPINGVTWPYHFYYFDKDETSIFAEGLATVMRDDQTTINSSTRLMLDNAAITAGPMLEVTTSLLSGQDKSFNASPWRVFHRNASAPGTRAVNAIEIPSRLNDLAGLADRFENNADEVSAIPRYMTGENVSQGAAGTASGMSMLMGAANIMIKDLVSSWDEGITRSFIKAMYRWNMQFNKDNSIKGDFDVKARGSSSLVAREVRAQQLDMFSQAVANPMDAPFIKRDKLLRQRAEAHELTDVVKTEEEVAAEQNNEMAKMQMQMQQAQMQAALGEMQQKVALLTAQAAKAMAEVELVQAKAIETKVASVYNALQAGGVVTQSPHIAPAGDEILRSSNWQDTTPDPSIAQLGGPPVQTEQIPNPIPPMQGPREGMQAGIETPVIE